MSPTDLPRAEAPESDDGVGGRRGCPSVNARSGGAGDTAGVLVIERCLQGPFEFRSRQHGGIEGPAATSVGEDQRRNPSKILDVGLVASIESGAGSCRPAEHEIGAQAFRADLQRQPRRRLEHVIRKDRAGLWHRARLGHISCRNIAGLVECEAAPNRLDPVLHADRSTYLDAQAEPIEQLWA